nr:class I SAM-dependent methyltransferase [Corallincola sp.]
RLLKADGIALIQAITIADQRYDQYVGSVDFVQRYIFPGGSLPSLAVMARHVAERTDMMIRQVEDIGLDYARTLADWRSRFEASLPQVRELGFSEAFIRLWRFYLCYCEGGFRERAISTVHLLLTKPRQLAPISQRRGS